MRLSELLDYDNIVIQCHDNPDADALACGYAVYLYLKDHGKHSSVIYGGRSLIRKGNLKLMIEQLHIPVVHVDQLEEKPPLLLTVDCQYHGGNVTHFDAEKVAVIDHHTVSVPLPEMNEVRSFLGSCATLIWQMLKDERYDANENEDLATALYYGLYMDTGNLAEIAHPLDKQLRDEAAFNKRKLTLFRNANMSIEDLEIAGAALMRSDYIEEYRCSIIKAAECDPNLLGIISDLVLEVDAVDVCMAFCVMQSGVKFSVRSCVKEVLANELAEEISEGIGSGGGHTTKAGGYIPIEMMIPEYQKYCRLHNTVPRMVLGKDGISEYPSESAIKAVLERRMIGYFEKRKQSQESAPKTKAVIFDLDGTLLDTLQDLTDAVNAALRSRNLPERSIEEVRRFVGNGAGLLISRAVPGGKENPEYEAVFGEFLRYYQEHCKDKTKPYPEILPMLEELKRRGIGTAIVSNKPDAAVKELSREHFRDYTETAIGEQKGVARKPSPDTVEKALEELNAAKEEAWYVGDSETDIKTAENAGIRCISVTWGFRSREELIESGAKRLIDAPMELLLHI